MLPPARQLSLALLKTVLQFFLVFGIFSLAIILSSSHAFAQSEPTTQTQAQAQPQTQSVRQDAYTNVNPDVSRDMHSYTQIAFIELSSTIICQLIGIDVINPDKGCIGFDPFTKRLGYLQNDPSLPQQLGGLFGLTTSLISATYTPPASTGEFMQYLGSNFGFAQTASAQQGIGFQGLGAVQKLFITFRNIVYLVLIVLFVIIGIAIMLRVKIDPRTVMTIQNQIPKLIIAIILVTFSYAIVGLMIDVMWTVTYFGINVITADQGCGNRRFIDINASSNPVDVGGEAAEGDFKTTTLGYIATVNVLNNPIAYVRDLLSDAGCFGSFDGIGGLAWNVSRTLGDIMSRTILGLIGLDEETGAEKCSGAIGFLSTGGKCLEFLAFGFFKYLISIVGFLLLLIALYAALFKIWIKLLKAYIIILIGVILAPLWIISGVLPGSSGSQWSFSQWIRHMSAHLALFPVTVFMFLLARVIASSQQANNPATAFFPPLIGNTNIPDNIGWVTAFAFIMITPDILEVLRDALKTPVGKYTANITKRSRGFSPGDALSKYAGYAYGVSMLRQSSFLPKWLGGRDKASRDAAGAAAPQHNPLR